MVIHSALLLAILASSTASIKAHPLHTTITEVTESNRTVRATIRVFADDFGTAVTRSLRGRPAAGAVWDAAAVAYITSSFVLAESNGRQLTLRSCGIRRTAELYWLCVEGTTSTALASLSVRNRVLCDVWDDQVNVVQATVNGSRRSLLFTKGDGSKPLS